MHNEDIWNLIPVNSECIKKDLTAKNGSQHVSCLYRPLRYVWNNSRIKKSCKCTSLDPVREDRPVIQELKSPVNVPPLIPFVKTDL